LGAFATAKLSQRPPAKPEACRRVSGSKPRGPSGGDRTRQPKRTPNSPVFILCKSFLLAAHSLGCAFTQILPCSSDHRQTFPATHTPGTVKLWESLRQSRRVSRLPKLRMGFEQVPAPHPSRRPYGLLSNDIAMKFRLRTPGAVGENCRGCRGIGKEAA